MIDDRFSLAHFENCNPESPEMLALTLALQREIMHTMRADLEKSFAVIAAKLRSLGHELDTYEVDINEEDGELDLAYRDLGLDQSHDDHRIRIHVDLVTSAGFRDCIHFDRDED